MYLQDGSSKRMLLHMSNNIDIHKFTLIRAFVSEASVSYQVIRYTIRYDTIRYDMIYHEISL